MKRLTANYMDPMMLCPLLKTLDDQNAYCQSQYCNCDNCKLGQQLVKLAELEDLEEQGLLLRLPCKVGTKVYHIAFNYKTTRKEKIVETTFSLEMLEDYKKWWFLTKSEAEKALAEMGV